MLNSKNIEGRNNISHKDKKYSIVKTYKRKRINQSNIICENGKLFESLKYCRFLSVLNNFLKLVNILI